ncbi:helix-turn-helix domain-containing protein [Streptomyces graminifolii]|uniref:helix-turn-helix domain-containing protein n=1 Tax=Streptomyces graminifolii TaxID=1266771 RepID=UPI0040582C83
MDDEDVAVDRDEGRQRNWSAACTGRSPRPTRPSPPTSATSAWNRPASPPTGPVARPGVSELPRFWKFADTSHFVRAFKKQYGQTPAQYARSQDAPLP